MTDTEDDKRAVQLARRRNAIRSLPMLIGFLVVYYLSFRWLEQRFHLAAITSANCLMVIGLVVAYLLMPALGWKQRRDPNPRLRWLMEERSHAYIARVRPFVFGLTLFGMGIQVVLLIVSYFDRAGLSQQPSSVDSGVALVLMPLVYVGLEWTLPADMDAFARATLLEATRRGWVICILASVTSLVTDTIWPGHLRNLIVLSLLGGMLTQQWVMVTSARRASADA